MAKTVAVIGHAFDCLPGHVTISARGKGATVRVATMRGVSNMLDDQRLRRKQIGDFKISVVVIADNSPMADCTCPGDNGLPIRATCPLHGDR
jgi:hypothetical protein